MRSTILVVLCPVLCLLLYPPAFSQPPEDSLVPSGFTTPAATPQVAGGVPAAVVNGPVPSVGAPALGIALAGSTGELYVLELFGGVANTYDLNLVSTGAVPSPAGLNTMSGIAWSSATNTLFWYDLTTLSLYETDLAGATLTVSPMMSPAGGLLASMAVDQNSATLWANDIVADTYYEYSFGGVSLGPSFLNPSGPGAFGNGIAWRPDLGAFDVPHGPTAAAGVNCISTVDATGTVLANLNQDLTAFVPFFVNGIESAFPGSNGSHSTYVVLNGTNELLEINGLGACFIRGDCDGNGILNPLVDALTYLSALFVPGSPLPPCLDACDFFGVGIFGLPGAIALLNFGFQPGSPPPAAPFPNCGMAMNGSTLGCTSYPFCAGMPGCP